MNWEMMFKMSCFGFTEKGHADYRGVTGSEVLEFDRSCAALCDDCDGVLGGDEERDELKRHDVKRHGVKRWAVTYRCKISTDTGSFCGFECVLLITKIDRIKNLRRLQSGRPQARRAPQRRGQRCVGHRPHHDVALLPVERAVEVDDRWPWQRGWVT